MNDFDWGPEDRYRSNGGAGPLTARILAVADGRVEMQRTQRAGGPFRVRFSLPLDYLASPRCGWRLAHSEPSEQ